MVGQASSDVIGVVLSLAEQSRDVVVVQPVLDLVALAPDRPDQAAIPQQAEVVRHRRLARIDREGEVAHTEGSPDQRVEDLCPRPVPERSECLDYQLEDVRIG